MALRISPLREGFKEIVLPPLWGMRYPSRIIESMIFLIRLPSFLIFFESHLVKVSLGI